jgi:hypothetical protein
MSEADLREGLRAAVGDEPPLVFDADELIRRAQHARRRRRALVAVAVMTLALTGTVLSLPYVVDQRSRVDAAAGTVLTTTVSPTGSPAPMSATTPPRPSTTAKPPVPTTNAPGAQTQLSAYLRQRFAEVVPDAKVVSADAPEAADVEPGSLHAWLGFVDGVGTSKVVVRLVAPPYRMTWDQYCTEIKCAEAVRQDDGTFVASSWRTTTVPEPQGLMCTLAHFRADGSVVEVTTYGYEPTAAGETAAGQVALTHDQLLALATDPKLGTP